jgi:aminoglycoside 3-N-acetyltransferase
MVVFGDRKKAEQFIKDDAFIATPTAPESCYGKLSSQNGYVLLVGVGQERNTYLHCVAEMLNIPDRMDDVEKTANVKRKNGEIVNRTMRLYRCSKSSDVSQRFPKYEVAFRYYKCITDGFIGNAPVQLCNAAKLKDTVELIFRNSNGEDPLATENPIPPKWYCNK